MDAEEVLRLARLAHIELDEDEAVRLASDLSRLVQRARRLASVELDDADGITHFESDVHREDRAAPGLGRDAALGNAPDRDDTYFLVPRVLRPEES